MRTLLFTTLMTTLALTLSSCTNGCGCGATNNDYLRDVPVTKSQSL
ncbi:MAG: hypothetical protein R3Y56_10455 [Akkermansia sp.]